MAGRGGAGRGHRDNISGCSGRGGCGGSHRAQTTKTGLTKELKGHIFDLSEQSSADLMHTMQINITQYIRSLYGGDIMGELEMKTEFVAPSPSYLQSVLNKKANYENMIRAQQNNELISLQRKLQRVQSQLMSADPTDTCQVWYEFRYRITPIWVRERRVVEGTKGMRREGNKTPSQPTKSIRNNCWAVQAMTAG